MSAGYERFVDDDTGEAIGRLEAAIAKPVVAVGPMLEVFFVAGGVARDVQHGLGVTPTGYLLLLEVGGHVCATDVELWNDTLAFLMADTPNMRARLRFVLTEVPSDA